MVTVGSRRRDRSRRGFARRLLAFAAAAGLAPGLVLGAPVAIPAARTPVAASSLPSGFVDETVADGLTNPTAIVFAPDGRVFVTEKRGVVKTWASVSSFSHNDAPTQSIDIQTQVMNYWDRGLLGLAVDPGYPGNPYLYLLYSHDDVPGGAGGPHWNDNCVSPPGATTDGCAITTNLDRVTIDPATGAATGRSLLLNGWCQQFPSHSAGSVVFGPDGMLYVSGGEGASFNAGAQDYGEYGGTKPDTINPITPLNPCGDPPGGVGGAMTAPTAEGGALRAQSFRRPAGEAAVLNGAILRLDPATGAAAAGNPAIGNADPIRRRIVAYGLRNPFRITFRPGTSDLYVGDVGYSTWEEVNRVADPLTGPANYGWPCQEGPQTGTYYTSVTLNLCSTLTGGVTGPLFDYRQGGHMASNDGCPPVSPAPSAGASVSGLAFYTGTAYPAQFRGGLFVADYVRNCIVVLPDSGGGVPSSTAMPFSSAAAGPVMLTTDPSGNLVYVSFNAGEIHRIRYQPPVASFTASPSSGPVPLPVSFDGSASSAPAGVTAYDWDFGDGSAHGSGVTAQHTYAVGGTFSARLTVTDLNGLTDTMSRTIAVSNTAPTVFLDAPTCTTNCWSVGDVVAMSAHATDTEDGTLPASAFKWHVALEHCHTPTDCHEHDLLDPTGVRSTSVVAPDHEAGSFLRITVTVTDSGGLTDSASIDVKPRQSTLQVLSSPAGLPVTLDGQTGNGSVGPTTEIVGHVATISTPSTVISGEDRWAFRSWSDGGAISHTVTVGTSPGSVTATFAHSSLDASNTCAGAAFRTPSGQWTNGLFGTAGDVDWVRFKVTTAGWYRMLLGSLPVDGTLALYAGCSTLVATSAQAGLHWEELIRSLAPGTYAIRMSNASGVSSATNYHWLLQALPAGAALLSSQAAPAPSGSVRLVGEVLNTSSTTRAITVTARLYSATGALLKTVSTRTQLAGVGKYGRSLFTILTTRPAGYASAHVSVTSVGTSPTTRLLATTGVTASAAGPGLWQVSGSVVNQGTTTATHVSYLVGIFGSSGQVLNATSGSPSSSVLAPGASATFTTTFGGLTTTPMATTTRAKAS